MIAFGRSSGSLRSSQKDFGFVVASATLTAPARAAATIPARESSKTAQSQASNPSLWAAFWYTSGAGLPCSTSSEVTKAAKSFLIPRVSSACSRFSRGVDEPTAHGMPSLFKARMKSTAPFIVGRPFRAIPSL